MTSSRKTPLEDITKTRTALYSERKVIRRIVGLYKKRHSYRAVVRENYPGSRINHGTIQRIVKYGQLPKDPLQRLDLGLEPLGLAPVCPIHGVVHVAARCPRPHKPRVTWLNSEEIAQRISFILEITRSKNNGNLR